jgi:hypothetical protein
MEIRSFLGEKRVNCGDTGISIVMIVDANLTLMFETLEVESKVAKSTYISYFWSAEGFLQSRLAPQSSHTLSLTLVM